MDALIRPATEHPVQEINTTTDTRDYLAKSRQDAERKGYADWLIVDIDAHHVETVSWPEVTSFIEDPVVRDQAKMYHSERIGAPPYGLNGDLGLRYQDVGGRIPHQSSQREKVTETDVHRDVVFPLRASTARACVSLLEASQRAYRRIARRVERAGAESASVPPPAQALTLGKKPRTSSLGERARLPARASSSLRAPRIASASSA